MTLLTSKYPLLVIDYIRFSIYLNKSATFYTDIAVTSVHFCISVAIIKLLFKLEHRIWIILVKQLSKQIETDGG